MLAVYHVVPLSDVVVSHFLILSRKPIRTALGSSCLKAGTCKTGFVLILMISDQWTYTCLHHNTPFYAFISQILIFDNFFDFSLHANQKRLDFFLSMHVYITNKTCCEYRLMTKILIKA